MLFARAHEVIERQARIPMAILDDSGRGPFRVKLRRTQYEQMSSAVAPTTDIVGRVDGAIAKFW
jgi:hypothetical protein